MTTTVNDPFEESRIDDRKEQIGDKGYGQIVEGERGEESSGDKLDSVPILATRPIW